MVNTMRLVECISFMLIQDGRVLAEKRKPTKRVVPGAIALPGGHIEAQESPEEALYREIREEVALVPIETAYICTLLHRAQEFRKLHYFAVTRWEGDIIPQEAESVTWIPLNALETFDLDVDKIAVQEYRRVYLSSGLHR
jgi:mutator protein MutT